MQCHALRHIIFLLFLFEAEHAIPTTSNTVWIVVRRIILIGFYIDVMEIFSIVSSLFCCYDMHHPWHIYHEAEQFCVALWYDFSAFYESISSVLFVLIHFIWFDPVRSLISYRNSLVEIQLYNLHFTSVELVCQGNLLCSSLHTCPM